MTNKFYGYRGECILNLLEQSRSSDHSNEGHSRWWMGSGLGYVYQTINFTIEIIKFCSYGDRLYRRDEWMKGCILAKVATRSCKNGTRWSVENNWKEVEKRTVTRDLWFCNGKDSLCEAAWRMNRPAWIYTLRAWFLYSEFLRTRSFVRVRRSADLSCNYKASY